MRLYNLAGGLLRRLGVPLGRLSEHSLLRAARRRTGFSDFGDEGFLTPLRILLKSYEEEAGLNAFGRTLARLRLLILLCNRLRIQNALEQHPEILDQPVRRPLIVVGLPRTGTTLLYNLLAQDPASRPLTMWEAMSPIPRPGEMGVEPDPRIKRTRRFARALTRLAPNLPAVHPIEPEGPEECSRLLLNTFVTVYFTVENHLPSYRHWFMSVSEERLVGAYNEYYRQLQALQWQRPPAGHWVLKSPAHLFCLGALLKVFPDARVVQTHRDPHKVIPSTCSLFAVCHGLFTDRVRLEEIGCEVAEVCAEGLRRGSQVRDEAPQGVVYDVHYRDLVQDPIGALQRVYEHFGAPFTDELEIGAKTWLSENQQNKHGKHWYDLEQFGLKGETIERLFGNYCQRYGIAPESRPASGQDLEQ
jgi:hypothetical protein